MAGTADRPEMTADMRVLAVMLELWRAVLCVDEALVEPDTHFFMAGGDSLQLATLLQRVRQLFGVSLRLHDAALFSTPRKMSAFCKDMPDKDLRGDGMLTPSLQAHDSIAPCSVAAAAEYPASAMQQGLWYETQCAGKPDIYNTAVALHLHGQLDIGRLQLTLKLLMHKHPVLRSRFRLATGKPSLQVHIAPVEALDLAVESVAAPRLHATLVAAASAPFDMAAQNACRFCLYRCSATHHVLFVCMHHCISDGWSGNVLLCSLASIWNGLSQNPAWRLPSIDTGQADYCLAEAASRARHAYADELVWWQARGADIRRCDDWLVGMTRAGAYQLAAETLQLPGAALQRGAIARDDGSITACSYLLCAFRLAIFELTGSDNCLIGMPVSCRHHSAPGSGTLDHSVGCFINLLLSQGQVTGHEPAQALLQGVHKQHLHALSHARAPYSDVLQTLKLERRGSGNAGFDILFTFHNTPRQTVLFTGLANSIQQISPAHGQYPLSLAISPGLDGFSCRLEYAVDIFTSDWSKNLLSIFRNKLRWLCT